MPSASPPESIPPLKSEVMIQDLVRMPQVLRRLAGQPLVWQPLAQTLLATSSEARAPTSRQLQQKLGIPASRYRRWLDDLYAEYLTLLETDAETIRYRQPEHQLILTGRRATQVFSCRLPVTPRVGEQLQLDFLRAVTGELMFYVDSLTHEFSGERYVILVYLKPGYYNSYRHSLLQRALFEETLSIQLGLHAPDYVLDNLLRELYPPPPESPLAFSELEKAEARYSRRSPSNRRRADSSRGA